jgi:hypothetical protein
MADLHISLAATKHGFDDVPLHEPKRSIAELPDDMRGDR